jgi:predicted dehydrogenase
VAVGFNRRFSPFTRWLKERFAGAAEPLAVHCTVNAGPVPPDHWTHDPEQGGGRIIGEVCHFVDLIQYLTGSLPVRVYAETLESPGYQPSDNVVITLKMANGAIGSITYVAGGDKRYPRERVEVFGGGAVGVIENFKAAAFIRGGRKKRVRKLAQRGPGASGRGGGAALGHPHRWPGAGGI